MGKKGGVRHLKRMPAPKFWPIHVKEYQWAAKPRPGPHPMGMCLPILVLVRDMLRYAKTAREARISLAEGRIHVDGKARRDQKFPVGLMDVVELPDVGKGFRVLPTPGKGLALVPIPREEVAIKLCRIENKNTLKAGTIQLNLHDGRNLSIRVNDPRSPHEDVYETFDTIQIALPDQEILKHIKLAEGAYGLIIAGGNVGRHGKIVKIEEGTATRPARVTIQDPQGGIFQTTADYVFTVGDEKPSIKLEAG